MFISGSAGGSRVVKQWLLMGHTIETPILQMS